MDMIEQIFDINNTDPYICELRNVYHLLKSIHVSESACTNVIKRIDKKVSTRSTLLAADDEEYLQYKIDFIKDIKFSKVGGDQVKLDYKDLIKHDASIREQKHLRSFQSDMDRYISYTDKVLN